MGADPSDNPRPKPAGKQPPALFGRFKIAADLISMGRMKSLTEYLWFELPARRGFVNITDTVAGLVQKSGVREGLCLVNAMHISPCVAHLSFLQKTVSSRGLGLFRRAR